MWSTLLPRGDVSGTQRIAYIGHAAHILPYSPSRAALAALDTVDWHCLTRPSARKSPIFYRMSGYHTIKPPNKPTDTGHGPIDGHAYSQVQFQTSSLIVASTGMQPWVSTVAMGTWGHTIQLARLNGRSDIVLVADGTTRGLYEPCSLLEGLEKF